jgi:restriction endonuclease S subunit
VSSYLLKDIKIPLPSLDEQHEIVEKMRSANRYVKLAKSELEAAQIMVDRALSLE